MTTKWVCLNNNDIDGIHCYLTLNKVYDGEYNQIRNLIFVRDDSGNLYGFYPERFRKLSDIREEQIKSIFDED
jgi:hypothetical protein